MMIFLYSLSKSLTLKIGLLTLLVMLAVPASAANLVRVYSSSHFNVYGVPGDDVRGEYVADRAEEWFDRLTTRLGAPRTGWNRIPIMVYPTHQAFVGSTGEEFGERLVGRAYSGSLRIELDASEIYAPMQRIIGHELAHIMVFRILGNRASGLPLWMHEGIAKTEAGEWDSLDAQIIADAAASNRIPRLTELENSFPDGKKDLAYAVSASAVKYISANTDGDFVKPVLAMMASGEEFDDAVLKVTGKPINIWENEWRHSVAGRYAIYGWMRLAGVIAGIAFPVLAVLAFLAIRRKKQIYLAQYEWEDGYDPAIDREYWPER